MDPTQVGAISAALAALSAAAGAGAGEGIKDTAKLAVITARDRLLSLLRRHAPAGSDAGTALTEYTEDPTPEKAQALRDRLAEVGVDDDVEVLELAKTLLREAESTTSIGHGSVAIDKLIQKNSGGNTYIGGVHSHGAPPDPQ